MAKKCSMAAVGWQKNSKQRIEDALALFEAKGKIETSPRKDVCQLREVCHYSCSSCPVLGGAKLHLEGKWSLGELSVIRWVAGIPVEADKIIDTPRIFHLNAEPKKEKISIIPKQEHFYRKPSESACPQGSAYCIIDLNPERQKEYEEGIVYFMNSFVVINLPLRNRERHLKQLYNFDFSKLRGDTVGFQDASEPAVS